jgi:hypothetical protein
MIIRILASDPQIQDQLTALAHEAFTIAKMEGEVLLISPEENHDIYHLEADPTIVIDDQLLIESFIPTADELAQVIKMQDDAKYAHDGDCAHGGCCGGHDDDEEKDDCCGTGSCGSCSCK